MTRTTVLLEVVDSDGMAVWRHLDRIERQSTPPSAFGDWQPGTIPIRIGHSGPPLGFVDYLEHGLGHGNGGIFGVGVVDGLAADELDGLVMCSPEIRANAMHTAERHSYRLDRSVRSYGQATATHATLDGVGLVSKTAGVTATKVRAWDGDYRDPFDRSHHWHGTKPAIIDRAVAAAEPQLRYRRAAQIKVHRPAPERYDGRSGGRAEVWYSAPYSGVLSVR